MASIERLIEMHEKAARTHERHERLGGAAFHSETADALASLKERAEKLEAANKVLADALDNIIMAFDLPGDHCEMDQGITRARKILEQIEGGND